MCGITGIYSPAGGPPIVESTLDCMNQVIHHRGPDEGGMHIEPNVGLAMRRLSILDIAGGTQPISNEDDSVWIIYNGEIYNFELLRTELQALGHKFKTKSDTEVILQSYLAWGTEALPRLNGMFAFAIWDRNKQRLWLARDRAGIKPLFWMEHEGRLLWGSEIKSILQDPSVPRDLDADALNQLLAYGFVPGSQTMFKGIHSLPPGHELVVEGDGPKIRRWWNLRYAPNTQRSLQQTTEAFKDVLRKAVKRRMIADVPLGAFLSGGIDSGSIVALMTAEANAPVKTFSMGYEEAGDAFDEREAAKLVAERYQTDHFEKVVQPDLAAVASKLVWAFDQPFEDSSALPNWYLSEMTREHVTVALSGLGGDEMLAGYERYRGALLAERFQWIPTAVQKLLAKVAHQIPDASSGLQWVDRAKRFLDSMALPFDERYFAIIQRMQQEGRQACLAPELRAQINQDAPANAFKVLMEEVQDAEPLNRALYADLHLYLAGDLLTLADRISMAHSLEVRVPFIDHEVMEFCATVPTEWKLNGMEKKYLLRRAARDWLPNEILERRKMGFSVPLSPWFRGPLKEWLEDTLSEQAVRDFGALDYTQIKALKEEHYSKKANRSGILWALATCILWDREVRKPRVEARV